MLFKFTCFWVEHSIRFLPVCDLVRVNVLLPCCHVCVVHGNLFSCKGIFWCSLTKKRNIQIAMPFLRKKSRLISFPYAICFRAEKGLLVFHVSFEVMVCFAGIDTFKIWIFLFDHICTLFSHAFRVPRPPRKNLNFFHWFHM